MRSDAQHDGRDLYTAGTVVLVADVECFPNQRQCERLVSDFNKRGSTARW